MFLSVKNDFDAVGTLNEVDISLSLFTGVGHFQLRNPWHLKLCLRNSK